MALLHRQVINGKTHQGQSRIMSLLQPRTLPLLLRTLHGRAEELPKDRLHPGGLHRLHLARWSLGLGKRISQLEVDCARELLDL